MDNRATESVIWNPYTKGYFEDPYSHLAECRKHNPVQQGIHKQWIIFEYEWVKKLLKAEGFTTSDLSGFFTQKESIILKNSKQCPFLSKGTKKWLMYLDEDEHKKAANLAGFVLNQFNFTEIVNKSIDPVTEDLKQKPEQLQDLVNLATNIALSVIKNLLGIQNREIDFEKCKRISHKIAISQDLFLSVKKYQEINQEMEWLFYFFESLYEEKIKKLDNTFTSFLIEKNENNKFGFSKDEIISLLIIFFMGGVETSKDSLSMIFLQFLQKPDLLETFIKADTKSQNIMIEEFLRFASPLQFTVRINPEELQIGDKIIPANSSILLCLASANRDENIFPNPNEVMINRQNNPHLAFGSGLHTCMGAKLARIELRAALPTIAPLLQQFELDEKNPYKWQKTIMMRGVEKIPVVLKK